MDRYKTPSLPRSHGQGSRERIFFPIALIALTIILLGGCLTEAERDNLQTIGMWHTRIALSEGLVWISIEVKEPERGYASVWIPELRVREARAGLKTATDETLEFVLDGGNIHFTGTYEKKDRISGIWLHYGRELQVTLERSPRPERLLETLYLEKDVTVGTSEHPLKGKLTLPVRTARFPLLILVPGSGPNDYDETIGPNRPLRDLAHTLADLGIASLRYDKRSYAYPEVLDLKPTEKAPYIQIEYAEDFEAALRYAEGIRGVRSVFALGHSLGGKVLPALANETALAGIILAGTPARPLAQLSITQNIYLVENGLISEGETGLFEVVEVMTRVRDHFYPPDFEITEGLEAAYYYDTDRYNPIEDLSKLDIPVLIVQGDADFQVSSREDFNVFRKHYGGKENFSFALINGMNHMFYPQPDNLPSEDDYYIPSAIDEGFVHAIAEWIHKEK